MSLLKSMSKQGSVIWLIILLCGLIMFFGWAVLNAQHQQTVNTLVEQINSLKQQVEEKEKLRNEEIEKLKEPVINNQATPAATSTKSATSSAKPKIATQSGEKK